MSNEMGLSDRYFELIDDIVKTTLKGKIRSKSQVYQMLVKGVTVGTGEIFERCLDQRFDMTQAEVDNPKSELKQAKAIRQLRALNTIRGEWEQWQEENRVSETITSAIQFITTAEPAERFTALLRVIDPNQQPPLTLQQLASLAKPLKQQAQQASESDTAKDLGQLAAGITAGLASWQRLEDYLVSWIYDQSRGSLGFEGTPEQRGPWGLWGKKVQSPLPQSLFESLALNQSFHEWADTQPSLELEAWVELAVILQCLQRGLVNWFDKMVYDSKMGAKLSISTFIVFAVIWSRLANVLNQTAISSNGNAIANGCFQVCLQILRTFAQRDYFPLYGGVFANFSGNYLQDALNYLDEPLRQVDRTEEKARILTLLGYSLWSQGAYDQANSFHQEALEIAREAGDKLCEIANFNHLSRICVEEENYADAINYSQRALILARQAGDRLGEANALVNFGYSEVFQAQDSQQAELEVYESAIHYLEQGRLLLERLGDSPAGSYGVGQSQALCFSSLGIAHVVVEQYQKAIAFLEQGWQAAQFSGDLYLQGVNLAYLAQACYSQQDWQKVIYTASLGAYLLEQIGSEDWRKPAGLLSILQGQMGQEGFQTLLAQQRSKIIAVIGVDGYDYIPELLAKYLDSI
ncbi:tetratricopeptide repeat protein [Moorena sp. SIO4A5]|uniref:tetratricopeptide repeat protein n=1 Tax=Moorena sp. SIO4A5 TaxID=2607838 RepID=UPI0013CBD972|nr:tetratricopeptide repeat protein [Moorena sp. SIO4A5]NEO23547.1 tetratricopeptide repeat protein [Moorena sp. SIO4A5]